MTIRNAYVSLLFFIQDLYVERIVQGSTRTRTFDFGPGFLAAAGGDGKRYNQGTQDKDSKAKSQHGT
jgi:hypothetical protein